MAETSKKILQAAAVLMCHGGYHAASFREIAKTIGVKSASIHYHFATKADLGAALVEFDTEKRLQELGKPSKDAPARLFEAAIAMAREAVSAPKLPIACIFSAELNGLPDSVIEATKVAQNQRREWMASVYEGMGMASAEAPIWGAATLATLDGAMMLARSQHDPELFDAIIDTIR